MAGSGSGRSEVVERVHTLLTRRVSFRDPLVPLQRIRRRLAPSLHELLFTEYLTPGETVIRSDAPSWRALLIESKEILILIGLLVLLLLVRSKLMIAAFLVALVAIAARLAWRSLQNYYTLYILTPFRVMVMKGVLIRRVAWVPWFKVTETTYKQNPVERLFGFADIKLTTAGEAFSDIANVAEPLEFHRLIVQLIRAKQGDIDATKLEKIQQETGLFRTVRVSARRDEDDDEPETRAAADDRERNQFNDD